MRLRISTTSGVRELTIQRRVCSVGAAAECHLQLDAEGVAAVHALIYREPGGLRIAAAAAEVPLLVNGQRVESQRLAPGDRFRLGQAELELLSEAAAPAEGAPQTQGSAEDLGLQRPAASAAATADAPALAGALLQQLERFSEAVLAGQRWPQPAQLLLGSLLQLTRAERGFILLEDAGRLRIVASQPPADGVAALELLSDSIVRRVLESGEAVFLQDASADPLFAQAPSVMRLALSSVVCVPLEAGDAPRGVLYLGNSNSPRPLGEPQLSLIRVISAQLALLLESARHTEDLLRTVTDLRGQLQLAGESGLVARSPGLQQLLQTLRRAAASTLTVLLTGETGTGKELLARFVHQQSPRASGPLVAINCAAIPEELLEGELFGHVKGAFTGALRDRPGLVEAAAGGTLFLDEIGEMSPRLQAKLLRTLQEHTVRRLGDQTERKLDLRVVAATHRDLADADSFRQDLYFRLSEIEVRVPPLRERPEDLEPLIQLFLGRAAAEFGRRGLRLSEEARQALRAHLWPGNVRELENRLQRGALLAQGEAILPADLGLGPAATQEETPLLPLAEARDRFIAGYVRQAIARADGDRERAARTLGIGLRSLYRYLQLDKEPT